MEGCKSEGRRCKSEERDKSEGMGVSRERKGAEGR